MKKQQVKETIVTGFKMAKWNGRDVRPPGDVELVLLVLSAKDWLNNPDPSKIKRIDPRNDWSPPEKEVKARERTDICKRFLKKYDTIYLHDQDNWLLLTNL